MLFFFTVKPKSWSCFADGEFRMRSGAPWNDLFCLISTFVARSHCHSDTACSPAVAFMALSLEARVKPTLRRFRRQVRSAKLVHLGGSPKWAVYAAMIWARLLSGLHAGSGARTSTALHRFQCGNIDSIKTFSGFCAARMEPPLCWPIAARSGKVQHRGTPDLQLN